MPTPEQPQATFQKFKDLVGELERARQSRIFCMVHSAGAHVCFSDFPEFVRQRKQFDNLETLELLLHSPGGHADFAYKLVKFFRRRCQRFNVIVPIEAKSAATVMCLGADAIFMGEFAELGPVDVQIHDPIERGAEPLSPLDEFKSMEFLRDYALEVFDFFTLLVIRNSGMGLKEAIHESGPYVTAMVRPLFEKIDPLEVGGHRRALAVGEEYAKRLLKLVGNPLADVIVQKLIWQYPSHEFGIDFDEAAELKLPVKLLDRKQDESLVETIMEMANDGISFTGFVGDPTTAEKKVPQKAGRRPRAVPTSSDGPAANSRRTSSKYA